MRKIMYFVVFGLMLVGISNVKASTYYTSKNGVDFTKEQYDYISELYYDGYQDVMSQEDLDKIVDLGLIGTEVKRVTMDSDGLIGGKIINTRSTSVYYAGRTLSIGSSCSTQCLVTLMAQWSCTPTIKSWDVIGFRVSNLTINSINLASITGTGYSNTYPSTDAQVFSNGFGYSIKLGNANNLKITTSMYTQPGGVAYGSYQHAVENVSKATSQSYNIGLGGYGYVFHFTGNAYGKYDGAPGVYKSVN